MPRLRLGVALLLPAPLATEVDGLRRALADGALSRVPPHLTFVPPVNVRVEAVPDALTVLRRAAATVGPFTLQLGPPTTFAPVTPTLHLAVSEPAGEGSAAAGDRPTPAMDAVGRLRDAVFVPPLERPLTFPFEPHVTLADDVDPEQIPSAVEVLEGYVVQARFERVHLLQERRDDDGRRRWVPVADVPFGPPAIVGRGGVELELTASTLLDPEATAFEAREWPEGAAPVDVAAPLPAGCSALVVTARRRGRVVGVVRGGASPDHLEVTSMLVAGDERRQGIAHHLLAAFRHEAGHP